MKSINNFGNIVKNLNEENQKIQAPKRDYNEVDMKTSYKTNTSEIQRPQFINKNLENKQSNFVELNTEGDVS